ncbi:hypothetical protein NM688_g7460 [Phlebia brevispora]|uniref:Uncharacterized protein n=1 Tax=Phlebia brevispora TaxID=194682 RepID=A0ACC1S558_9APHY|nr:hypothetical protein NM688_g7460 [Phlebia brevispora]
MVRVGGGWAELSKFIKEHFADAFRLLPDSPVRAKGSEEKWISSATLTQAIQVREANTPLSPPRTPEPRSPIPSFAILTPSPRSVESSGSPLRAIQFIRRADRDSPVFRPDTPTRAPRSLGSSLNTPRPPVWRP